MAKLDDFGRPIYETAEEYNKAHKAGKKTRTYENADGDTYQHNPIKGMSRYKSVAQKHATVQGSKKAMKTVAVIGVLILAFNIGIIFSLVGNFAQRDELYYEEEVCYTEEYLSDGNIPLPEGYELFFYNGERFSIPTNYGKISQMGLESSVYYGDDLISPEYEELIPLLDENGYLLAEIRFINNTDREIPLNECLVDYIYIENPATYDDMADVPDFVFGDGLTFESSYEEVEEYFGVPYWHYAETSEEFDYHLYQWMYYPEEANALQRQEDIQFVEVKFIDGVIESVTIEKRTYEEK